MKPNWNRNLSEVLKQKTRTETRKSEKTGNEYQVDVIDQLKVLSTGQVEQRVGNGGQIKYKYSIVDTINSLEYEITAPNKVKISFGTPLIFKGVTGGQIGNRGNGWYSAESVELAGESQHG